jgi:hypothetical protein
MDLIAWTFKPKLETRIRLTEQIIVLLASRRKFNLMHKSVMCMI